MLSMGFESTTSWSTMQCFITRPPTLPRPQPLPNNNNDFHINTDNVKVELVVRSNFLGVIIADNLQECQIVG